jgi:hypothetical protein
MGTKVYPDHILRRMPPEERKALGPAGLLAEEALALRESKDELNDHRNYIQYLQLVGLEFVHSNPVKRPTIEVGFPDFGVFGPGSRVLFLEFKRGKNTLTDEQKAVRRRLELAGCRYEVAYSLAEAIGYTKEVFGV